MVGYFLPLIEVDNFPVALVVALTLGIVNATLGNVLKLIALPITILTLGTFAFVINGFMFWLVSRFIEGFHVESFWWAVLGAFMVSVVSAILNRIFLGSDGKVGGS